MSYATKSAEEFIKGIQQQRDQGYGFVPLIGAGASAPSGVPLINDFAKYLQHCIAMALGLDAPGGPLWDPRTSVWPPFQDLHQAGRGDHNNGDPDPRDVDWVQRVKCEFERRLSRNDVSTPAMPRTQIVQESLGAMAEWKSSLLFLSRLRGDGPNIELGDQDQEVIDRFFAYVVQGKTPTLVHRMLALLADLLHFETILTTNFDELFEDAFRSAGIPLDIVDVHLQSGLPPYSSMGSRRTLVKLHGGKYGLRADYSLATYPSQEDRRQFTSYLLGRSLSAAEWEGKPEEKLKFKNHLLVLGYSGGDLRINSLIEAALKRSEPGNLKVFWCCYSDDDVKCVCGAGDDEEKPGFLQRVNEELNWQLLEDESWYMATRHSFLGLLFQQLYQHLSLSLPPAGVVFPSVAELPNPVNSIEPAKEAWDFRQTPEEAWSDSVCHRGDFKATRRHLDQAVNSCAESQSRSYRCVAVYSSEDVYGVSSVASEVFTKQMIQKGRQCVWLDTDDISTPDALFEQVLGAVAHRAGVADWVPLLLGEDTPNRARELARITKNPPRQWVIFVHVRDGAGSNTEDQQSRQPYGSGGTRRPNGWADDVEENGGSGSSEAGQGRFTKATTRGLLDLIKQICADECGNVTVVILCREGRLVERFRVEPGLQPIILELEKSIKEFSIEGTVRRATKWVRAAKDPDEVDYESVVPAVRDDAKSADTLDARLRFLYALVLCMRTRYPALLWSWAFHGPRVPPKKTTRSPSADQAMPTSRRYGLLRFELTHMWIEQLGKLDVIRRKAGGFVWIHARLRNRLREEFAKRKHAAWLASDIHHCLAEWYHKLFASSGDPMAAFEVVHHRCHAAIQGIRWGATKGSTTTCRKAHADLREARAILKIAKHSMLSKMFSQGKCDKLKFLRDRTLKEVRAALDACRGCKEPDDCKLKEALSLKRKQIELLSHRLGRAIAREVAEHTEAFRENQRCLWKALRVLTATKKAKALQVSRIDAQCVALAARIEFHNQAGTLCIACRAYRSARECFEKVYGAFGFQVARLEKCAKTRPDDDAEVIELAEEWAAAPIPTKIDRIWEPYLFFDPNADPIAEKARYEEEIRLGIIETLQRHMQLYLVEGHANHLQARRVTSDSAEDQRLAGEMTQCYRRASACFRAAVEIMRFLPAERQQELYYDRQRLETQYGLALSYRRDFSRAHRRLNQADAFLALSPVGKRALELAVIELHHAEVFTQQAVFEPNTDEQDRHSELAKLRQQVLRRVEDKRNESDWKLADRLCDRDMLSNAGNSAVPLQLCKDYLDRARRCLDRAERLLGEQRKNVWWVTWFFELKLKVIELTLFAALREPDGPVPVVDLPFAPRFTATEPDRLLDDARRMVRLDVFRMARIVESYARCLEALTVRCDTDEETRKNLRHRRGVMRERCETSCQELQSRLSRRCKQKSPELDGRVEAYVEGALERVDAVVSCSKIRETMAWRRKD